MRQPLVEVILHHACLRLRMCCAKHVFVNNNVLVEYVQSL